MLLNADTAIVTAYVILVPYEAKHVPTYHGWMQDEDIREMTASELLTLGQEYEMQNSWRHDHDKLTFIICTPLVGDRLQVNGLDDRPECMIGDINLFLSWEESDETAVVGEVEVMIARASQRGHGLGRHSLLTFLRYIVRHEQDIIKEFQQRVDRNGSRFAYLRARIGEKNRSSIRMFETIGFRRQYEEANIFGELELRTIGKLSEFLEEALKVSPAGMYHEVEYSRQDST